MWIGFDIRRCPIYFRKMSNTVRQVCRLLLLPLFPVSIRNKTPRDGEVASKLFLSHVLAGIVVLFGVLSGQKAVLEKIFFSKWAAIIICICVGVLAVLSLLISSYRQRPRVQSTGTEEDSSIILQLTFLWGFGLALMIYLGINIVTYFQCAMKRPDDFAHSIFLILVDSLYIMFTVFQVMFLTYNKRYILKATIHLHCSIANLFIANFV